MRIALAAGALAGCGGEEFGPAVPNSRIDGSADSKPPSHDRSGAGGRAGTGGSGSAGTSGSGGTGGTGGDDAGIDDATDDPGFDAPGTDDGSSDDGAPGDDTLGDGPSAIDGDSGDPHDVSADHPQGDGPVSADAMDATDSATQDGSDAWRGDATCSEPVTYYKDDDGDGFGSNVGAILSCTFPGNQWSVLGGDCRDDLSNVKPFSVGSPDPPLYSGTGYADPNKPQGVSFDFDCSGTEQADPSNSHGNEPDCSKLLNCTGIGYVPVNPSRTGPGINPLCGSTTLRRCSGLLPCTSTLQLGQTPYRCR
jgi:hypothetical protein